MHGLLKLARDARGPEYTDTGVATDDERARMLREAVADIERIRKEQEKLFEADRAEGFKDHFRQLEQKRIRYQKRKKNKEFGLRRHRQKRIVGKRHRRNDRLWEKGMILKQAYLTFKGVEDDVRTAGTITGRREL